MNESTIANRVERIMETIPEGVALVAAAKSRTVDEVRAAIRAGASHVGHNYVQEAAHMTPLIEDPVRWHMIGHLQRNKVKRAVQIFDVIETVDSWRLAKEIHKRCAVIGKVMAVLVEINSGREASKTGVLPQDVDELVQRLSELPHIHIQGLMTMGPRFGNPEDTRPYFKKTKDVFDRLKKTEIVNVEMCYLSMGMSNSYQIAIEEGANIVRIGSKLFGEKALLNST
jgi:pyridoxal phosphate enzyme (YggS family)